MDFTELAQAFKRATPSVWLPYPSTSKAAGQVADGAAEDIGAITVIMQFGLEEREAVRDTRYLGKNRRRYTHYDWEAPKVNSEASFLTLIEITRIDLNAQHQERFNQARTAFKVALIALTLGIVLVLIGVGGIFVISLPVGAATAASSSISSIISAVAFRFNKEANDRLDNVTKELNVLERTSVAIHYIGYLSHAEKKDQAITDLIKQLYAVSPDQNDTKKG